MMRPTTWIAVAVIATATLPSRAFADGKNEIRAVTFDEQAGTTRVHVRGAETPTFTVYKLERPSRVVLDVPRARLAEALKGHEGAAVLTPSTWAVSTIAAQQIDDGGEIVRVVVTLARPGRYDVKTVGNEVVLIVTARDAAPRTLDPAELEQAKRAAAAAEAARASAQQEAERLRKIAAEQAARAEAAQRAADQAKRAGQQANQVELARAKDEAARAKRAAQTAQAAADRARVEAEQAQRAAIAEANRAKAEAAAAKQDTARAKQQAAEARELAAQTRAAAEAAQAQAARSVADAQQVKQAAEAAQAQAARSVADAERAKAQAAREAEAAERAKAQAAREAEAAARTLAAAEAAKQQALREAEAAKAQAAREAEAAKHAAAREATAAKQRAAREAEAARLAAAREAEAARADLARTKAEAEAARAELARAKAEANTARREGARAKAEAAAAQVEADKQVAASRDEVAAAKAEAARARAEAEAAKTAAAADRKQAERARIDADRMLRDAKTQLATLDKKTQAIQALEDKARAQSAAAQAREDKAREEVARAAKERAAAEAAAKAAAERAALATKQSSSQSATLAAEAKAAEARLADARRQAEDAERRKRDAEQAAAGAKKQLAQTRSMLTAMEQQRAAAEEAATTAARKRGEAEAAATDASRRRSEAETAAAQAAARRKEAEAAARAAAMQRTEAERERALAELQKKLAEDAARTAKAAADAADKQREIAEAAARTAGDKRAAAEASLAQLTAKRKAAEQAAQALEARSQAEAKAKAEIAAAEARKASQAELAAARAEAARLAKERSVAEAELADRRKAVAKQQAEASRLETAAAQARDAATREEARRAQLAQQRVIEEQELARIKAQKQAAPVAVAQAARKGPAAKVNDIRFQGDGGSALVDIAMTPNAAVTVGAVTATHAELIIDNAELAAKLERKLDVTRFGSPVRAVSSFRDRRTPNRVRVIAELAQPATPVFDRDGRGGKWRFVANRTAAKAPVVQNVPPQVVGGFGATSTPVTQQTVSQLPPQGARGRRVYRGATVDFDFKDAPMHDLLRLIGDTGRVNIVIPDVINPKVTVRLKRVPWDQALEVILASHGLWYRRDGNLYRIAPRKELDAEDEAEAARREAAVKSEAPRSQVVPLNYAAANELRGKLEPMLSPKGRIETDERTNSLIIVDVAGNRAEIERLALSLDTQTPQISIEARIVEARSTFIRQFGIQWGGRATASQAGGNATGLIFPSSIDFRGANSDAQTNDLGIVAPSDFAVNMPAATGTGEGGAVGLSLGSIGGNFGINLRLSALEDTGTIRIISAPKITVLNNKPATISQGVSIPISVISAAGTQTQFVQADLSLQVTPYVSQRDCSIAMTLTVTKNEPDFVNVGARGDPTILRKEARTSMLVADGETSVLGGIYTRNSGLSYKKVPFFAEIPVLGWFFKNRRENDDRTEILVFITPKITNRSILPCR